MYVAISQLANNNVFATIYNTHIRQIIHAYVTTIACDAATYSCLQSYVLNC